jgi:hypothetical protein
MKCWVCDIEVTKENAAGMRKGKPVGTCKECNVVYSMVQYLSKFLPHALKDRVLKSEKRLVIHQTVLDHQTKGTGEITKLAVRRLRDEM